MLRHPLLVACCFVLACGSDAVTPSTFDDGGADANGDLDSAPAFTLRVDPPTATSTIVLGTPPALVVFHAFKKDAAGVESDVTSGVTWSVDDPTLATADPSGNVKPSGTGGKTKVRATLTGVSGAADLVMKLTGDVYAGGADQTAKQKFAAATPDANPANAPSLEYPEDGVVLPGNLPPVELQWSQASDNNVYRAHFVAQDVLDVYVYGLARELTPPAPEWKTITSSVRDVAVSWTVDAVGPSNLMRTSAARAMTATSDTIDQSSIYVWQSSTGSFRVIDIAQGKDFALPSTAPELAPNQPCSGCHRISRDGKRFSYTYNGGNFEFGTLAYDDVAKTYVPKVKPTVPVRATYATFNPNESTQIPAMIVTVPDTVPQNTAGTVRLEMHNPDTYATVPSNVAAMVGQIDPSAGHATSMPDWSADGALVAFSAYDSNKNFVRLLGDDIVLASIVEAPISYANGTFTFGTPKVLVAANSNDNPDTGINNVLPTISPDNSAIAFTRAAGWWSIKTQQTLLNLSGQIMLVRRSDSHVFELVKGSNGPGTTKSSTWPQWAPTLGSRYAWLAYASERPYGHELTPQNKSCGALVQGQGSCKQLWVMAIDLQKMKAGTDDPSFAPFWIPGQSIHAQYVSPQWTKAVLPTPN